MDSDFRYLHSFVGIECELYSGDYRCHVDFSIDGTYHGNRTRNRAEQLRIAETFFKELFGGDRIQCDYSYALFLADSAG